MLHLCLEVSDFGAFWIFLLLFLFIFSKIYFFIVVLGVHCGIYKSFYNISYLNSLPPLYFGLLIFILEMFNMHKYSFILVLSLFLEF
jgi:hypothetical protein